MRLKIKRMGGGVDLPSKAFTGDAGFDVRARLPEGNTWIQPGCIVIIPTGLKMEIEEGYELQVRSRSGLSFKKGLVVINSPGTIDSGYIGEIMVGLINHSKITQVIGDGDRIAQLVPKKVEPLTIFEVSELSDTTRGTKGIGSTGR